MQWIRDSAHIQLVALENLLCPKFCHIAYQGLGSCSTGLTMHNYSHNHNHKVSSSTTGTPQPWTKEVNGCVPLHVIGEPGNKATIGCCTYLLLYICISTILRPQSQAQGATRIPVPKTRDWGRGYTISSVSNSCKGHKQHINC